VTVPRSRAATVAAAVLMMPLFTPILGCALLSRGKSLEVRWYTPERLGPNLGGTEMQGGCELRLTSVTSGADLGPRIRFGDGFYQVGQYEGLRWTERPEHFVRRALGRTLFEDGMFRRSLKGGAPTLDVELLDFEEVKTPRTHAARIAIRVVLASDRVLVERTVVMSSPVIGDDFDDFVAAMGRALDGTAEQVALTVQVATGCR
jgi:hypothetical protein